MRLITGKNDNLFIVASLTKPAYEICVLFSAKQVGARRSTVLSFSHQLVFLAHKCSIVHNLAIRAKAAVALLALAPWDNR